MTSIPFSLALCVPCIELLADPSMFIQASAETPNGKTPYEEIRMPEQLARAVRRGILVTVKTTNDEDVREYFPVTRWWCPTGDIGVIAVTLIEGAPYCATHVYTRHRATRAHGLWR